MTVYQPQGSGVGPVKHGTIIVQAPQAVGTGWYNDANYRIDDRVLNVPTTGTFDAKYSGRFDDIDYYRT